MTAHKPITITIHDQEQAALIAAIKFYQDELNKREQNPETRYPTNLYHHTSLTAVLHEIYRAQNTSK